MKTSHIISILLIIIFAGVWFYQKMNTPQLNTQIKVHNLPWQITVVDRDTLHVLDLDVGRSTLEDAVALFGDEYKLAWFEQNNEQGELKNIALEAYFSSFRENIIGNDQYF